MDVTYRHAVRLVEILQILVGFSQLFFHSYSHGIFFRRYEYSYSPRATCILVCHSCYTSCLTETLLRSSKRTVDKDNAARIPVQQYQLDYYRYRELRACRIIRRVCIPWAFDQSLPFAVHCVLRKSNNALVTVVTNITAEKCYPILRRRVFRKLSVSGHMLCNICDFF